MAPKHKREQDQNPAQPIKRSKRLQQKNLPQDGKEQSTQHKKQKEPKTAPKSILGGLKDPTLDSRVSASNANSDTTFSVPYRNDKKIVCERHGNSDPASETKSKLIFTHGAGGGLANPATRLFAEGYGALSPVVCMQGTMNLKSRVDTFRTVVAHERGEKASDEARALGGRSMGARAATIAATEEYNDAEEGAEPLALVLVSYPLISGGAKGKGDVRDQILYDLPEGTSVLFIVGIEDTQCPLPQLEGVIAKMKGKEVWLMEVQRADHSMSLKPKGAVEPLRRESGEIAARWVSDRDYLTDKHVVLEWDEEREECVLGDPS
ncbi:hypothetical protein K431DRAFT_145202 [Polychaeton citri CBS 116435]|uniref:KANL3/Tex30 alpha/beta hydrolase-like domain-containing protein n=1 Tax=Polychaeton citri CBS 116435 TaxID=1314669 RepID=A0A9P4UTU4_9PEZI|nr:hypothetical protein K431DRAFT_145202 [Polychaeton citri CBS 116435]